MDAKLKIAHLQMIQGVINRMAGNSFALKGWSVGIISALFALATAQTTPEAKALLVTLAYFPAMTFWLLDAYFLRQERLFRDLYRQVAQQTEDEVDFSMNTKTFENEEKTILVVAFSSTLRMFHGVVIILVSLILWLGVRV